MFIARQEAQEQAQAALLVAAERMKWYFDQHKQEVPFKVGDHVLIKGKDLRVLVKTPKLAAQNYGPYEITQQLGPATFKLKLPRQMRIHPVFHASKLIPYHVDDIAGRNPPKPQAIEVDGIPEFEVEEILDSRVRYRRVQYLIKWVGYSDAENTWEPARNVAHAQKLLKKFHQLHPNAPKPISATDARPIESISERLLASTELSPEEGVV